MTIAIVLFGLLVFFSVQGVRAHNAEILIMIFFLGVAFIISTIVTYIVYKELKLPILEINESGITYRQKMFFEWDNIVEFYLEERKYDPILNRGFGFQLNNFIQLRSKSSINELFLGTTDIDLSSIGLYIKQHLPEQYKKFRGYTKTGHRWLW